MTSAPDPSTATVRPPPASAPRCAAESTPRASPLTTIDAARREIASEPLRHRKPVRRRGARADDRDDRLRRQSVRATAHPEHAAADRRSPQAPADTPTSLHGSGAMPACGRARSSARLARRPDPARIDRRSAAERSATSRAKSAGGGSPARSRSATSRHPRDRQERQAGEREQVGEQHRRSWHESAPRSGGPDLLTSYYSVTVPSSPDSGGGQLRHALRKSWRRFA